MPTGQRQQRIVQETLRDLRPAHDIGPIPSDWAARCGCSTIGADMNESAGGANKVS